MLHAVDPQIHDIAFVFLGTGLRRDELIHLEWENVDIEHSMVHVRKKEGWTPKWEIERSIPVQPEVLEVLNRQPRYAKTVFCSKPYRKDSRVDRPLTPGWTLRRLQRAVQGMEEFRNIGLHTLRHTFISHLVMNGVDLRTVMALAGHRNFETTLRYAHLAPEHLRDAMRNGGIKLGRPPEAGETIQTDFDQGREHRHGA